jgi:phosphoribosylanthranilate isomerase
VNEAQADFAGMIFADTRRKVTDATARDIRRTLDARIPTVGVFVNHDTKHICRLAEQGIITIIQLHGDEPPEIAEQLKKSTGLPIIKAFRVREAADVKAAKNYPADYYLFDTYHPGSYGGTGETFDWNLLQTVGRPYFLAGGLQRDNIVAAQHTGAYALDISSGVETEGKKDPAKIKEIVAMVHSHRM